MLNSLSPPPESFFVFVVGHCEEWPEGRAEQGDTAIYTEYLDFGVPADQCMYLKDNDCTRKNCQDQLDIFLRKHRPGGAEEPKDHLRNNKGDGRDRDVETERQKAPDTLVFYYGGHGSAHGFATIGGTWPYEQVAKTIQECFHGDRVLFLIDCCASGNLWRHIPTASGSDGGRDTASNSTVSKSFHKTKEYALFATSQPYIAATADGEEWILTNSWIQLMRDRPTMNNGSEENTDVSLERMISILADRNVFETGDLLYAYLSGRMPSSLGKNRDDSIDEKSLADWSWMPAKSRWSPKPHGIVMDESDKDKTPPSTALPSTPLAWLPSSESLALVASDDLCCPIPKEAAMLPLYDCRVGDPVAYKHPGGYPRSVKKQEQTLPFYVPPLWLHGRIVSIFETETNREVDAIERSDVYFRIRVWYPSQQESWDVEVPHNSHRLINQFFVVQNWMLPRAFCKTQVVMAQKYRQYLDCSMATNTPVWVRATCESSVGGDNVDNIRVGRVIDWKDFNWKNILYFHKYSDSGKVIFPGKTRYDDYYWDELPLSIKAAALALGYTKTHWDEDIEIPADGMDWGELSEAQKGAAGVLGYVRQKPVVGGGSLSGSNGDEGVSFSQRLCEISKSAGPHVPVEWNNNHQSSLVPLQQIIFAGTNRIPIDDLVSESAIKLATKNSNYSLTATDGPSNENDELHELQMLSLLEALTSSGKAIGDAESFLGTKELSAFWPECEKFFDAEPIDVAFDKDNIGASLDLLATHFDYMFPGVYCPIIYEDGVRHLVPLSHIYRRGCQPQLHGDEDEDEGDKSPVDMEDGSSTKETSTVLVPTKDAMDETKRKLRDVVVEVSSFGEQFSEVASKLEDASGSLRVLIDQSSERQAPDRPLATATAAAPDMAADGSQNIPRELSAASRSYVDEYWGDLPEHVRRAALRVGYTGELWDSDGSIPLDSVQWNDLSGDQREALVTIGYNEAKWNAEDDSESEEDDDSCSSSSCSSEDY